MLQLANINLFKSLKRFIGLTAEPQHYAFDNVLGTVLDLNIIADLASAELAMQRALDEIDRLNLVFNRFDKKSELNQWLAKDSFKTEVSADLYYLLEKAELYTDFTDGAFQPAVDGLSLLWQAAEKQDSLPTDQDILDRLEPIQSKHYQTIPNSLSVERLTDLALNFNAIAKGHIVDSAATLAFNSEAVEAVVVNIGGDIRHISNAYATALVVAVTNPFEAAHNQRAEFNIKIKNQAVATSGSSERGFMIKDNWYSHVIDPRTGWPVQNALSTTVIADDCLTADVLATALLVLEPKEGLALTNKLQNVGCHIVSKTGKRYTNEFFKAHIMPNERSNYGN